jgi:hypothetical protein
MPYKDPAKQRAYAKAHYQKNKEVYISRVKAYDSKRLYGITLENKADILAEQGGVCACCGSSNPFTKNGFSTDHDHLSGKVRGVLCKHCNTGLGLLGDNIAGLEQALLYLKRSNSS